MNILLFSIRIDMSMSWVKYRNVHVQLRAILWVQYNDFIAAAAVAVAAVTFIIILIIIIISCVWFSLVIPCHDENYKKNVISHYNLRYGMNDSRANGTPNDSI